MKEILAEAVSLAFRRAKIAQLSFLGFQILIFVLGLIGAFIPAVATFLTAPVTLLVIFIGVVFLVYIAESCKSTAEELLRHHEYWDSYGTAPPAGLLPELALTAKDKLSAKKKALFNQGLTFASTQPVGDRRCLENLRQSAWFTSYLTGDCAKGLGALVILVNIGTIILLTYTLQAPLQPTMQSMAAQSVCAAILFLQGVGLIPAAISFFKVSNESWDIVREVIAELKNETPDSFKEHRLLTEYQILRSSAPLIPDALWIATRPRMNPAFEIFRQQEEK
jgi:hypothetical protein